MARNYFDVSKYCKLYPEGYVPCTSNAYLCSVCEIADRFRAYNSTHVYKELFIDSDALPQTKKGCVNFFRRPLILKPEAMNRIGIELLPINQIVIPELGPGLFDKNPTGFIDCKLFVNQKRSIIVYRHEVYGAASLSAIERYDKYFCTNLAEYCKRL